MATRPALEVEELSRTFRSHAERIEALRGVTFEVGSGQLVGVLGLNGAGKTTLIKIISTLLLPTSGTARVAGYDVVTQTEAARRHLAVVLGGDRGFYNRVSGRENALFFAVLSGIRRRDAKKMVDTALEGVGLGEAGDRPVETYSKGMRQRLHLAVGLLTAPPLLMLDEPTVGLDTLEAARVRDSIASLRGSETAVILTSHYLGDIEQLADRVLVLEKGAITHDLPLQRLLERAGSVAEVIIEGSGEAPATPAELAGVRLVALMEREDGQPGWVMRVKVEEWSHQSLEALSRLWPDRDVTDVRIEPASLERVFADLARGTAAR